MEAIDVLGCLEGGLVFYRIIGKQGIDYDLWVLYRTGFALHGDLGLVQCLRHPNALFAGELSSRTSKGDRGEPHSLCKMFSMPW